MRLFFFPVLALYAVSACAAGVCAAPDDAATIRRQSQAFSDASAHGDAKALAKYLDDNVVFVNESGVISSKKDIVEGTSPPPEGIRNTLVQSDLVIKMHGNVAVTSFTDNATVRVYGQTSKAQFRSTEVWLKEGGAWRMISSQTLALPDDPPPIPLTAAALDPYVGTYTLGPKLVVKIERRSEGLVSATNGGSPLPLRAEAPDVFFTPGQPRVRRIFKRDAVGKIIGFNARREGHDLYFTREA